MILHEQIYMSEDLDLITEIDANLTTEDSAQDDDALLLNLEGYEGPIDMLLDLARKQKLDLMNISILQLAKQYIAFIEQAHDLQLDVAAEYLVMAAWLAYLKSRLLLPAEELEEDELTGEEMAAALQFQLRRLEAMQDHANLLFERPKLGWDIYARGMGFELKAETEASYDVNLYDLLSCYGGINRRRNAAHYTPVEFNLMSMDEAMDRLKHAFRQLPRKGDHSTWMTLQSMIDKKQKDKMFSRSTIASVFTAGLEMAKYGDCEIRQDAPLRPLYMRAKIKGK